jgi:hypothetical protein
MPSPFDSLPQLDRMHLPREPYPGATRLLGHVFKNTDTTYKFYWFLSLLEHAQNANAREDLVLSLPDLAREMVVQAWHSRRLFKLWFGHQDKLQTLIDGFAPDTGLEDNAKLPPIRAQLKSMSQRRFDALLVYVPYRFLAPWLRAALTGVAETHKNATIQFLSSRSQLTPYPTPYAFDQALGRPSTIKGSARWVVFFQSNYLPLRAFTFFWLAKYFETRNPGVPGIINKLEAPQSRNLRLAELFWELVQREVGLTSIYSGDVIMDGEFSIDHFIPWSFVTHDLIWNLSPVLPIENLRKSDAVPDLKRYLPNLLDQHVMALRVVRNELARGSVHARSLESILKQYGDLLRLSNNQVLKLPPDDFKRRVSVEFEVQVDLAKRLGFKVDWILDHSAV